jgi:hypothetical protein
MALPGQKWYYNSNTGAVEAHYPETFFEVHIGIGWHGPFNSQQEALNYYNQNKAANPGWHAPSGLAQQITEIPSTLGKEAGNAVGGSSGVFHGINLESWFLRIGEVLIGVVLIGVALAHLTGTSNVVSKAVSIGKFL